MFKKFLNWLTGGSSKGCTCGCNKQATGDTLKDLESFVEYVVKALVDYPEDVQITAVQREEGAVIQVRCRKEDVGKIVGKRGKIIMSIRSLVSGAAGRNKQRISVDVLD